MLNISERTIFRHIREGELKGFKAGREWRFEQKDIDAFIVLRRKKAEAELERKRMVADTGKHKSVKIKEAA